MIKKAIFTATLLMSFVAQPILVAAPLMHSKHAPAPTGPKIKVLLEKDATSALLEAKGSYRVVHQDRGVVLSSGMSGKRFVVHALQDGLRWGEEYPDVFQICVIPTHPDTVMYVNGIQYKGAISVYHVRNNRITIVNEVAIEDFLKSTLAVQFDQPLSKEAMSALAIAARTDAYSRALQGESSPKPWDVVADEVSYFGRGVARQGNGVEEAVDWSRYMVMESVKNGELISSCYLAPSKAEELAHLGYDAQQIIKASFPLTKIGATIHADEVSVR